MQDTGVSAGDAITLATGDQFCALRESHRRNFGLCLLAHDAVSLAHATQPRLRGGNRGFNRQDKPEKH